MKHYVSKPFDLGLLLATMRVALREAGNGDDFGKVWGGSTLFRSVSDSSGPPTIIPIASQLSALEKKLDAGFRLGNLCMIEGPSATGKSLLAQDVTSGALDKGLSVAYFASQHTPRSLEAQVKSIGMNWSEHVKSEKLVVYLLQPPVTGQDSGKLLAELSMDMERAQSKHEIIILDAITNLASSSQEQAIIGFFTTCKRLTTMGLTIFLVSHSMAFNADLLARASSMCETHLDLRTGKVREKVVRVVKVAKLDDVDLDKDNEVSFGVEPGIGISIIPYSSAKACAQLSRHGLDSTGS